MAVVYKAYEPGLGGHVERSVRIATGLPVRAFAEKKGHDFMPPMSG